MEAERTGQVLLQERDFDLLVDLYVCRVMSLRHICDLHFGGRLEATKKRIQKLKAAGLVRERPRRIGEPSVLHLAKKAFVELQQSGRLESFPQMPLAAMEKRAEISELTLRHELEVMDVRTAFLKAVAGRTDLSVTEFSTWPALYQFPAQIVSPSLGRRELLMKPDGFIRLREEETGEAFEQYFFLEVDRSTETQEIIGQKAACYLDFYQRGGMAERFGALREEFRNFPFRVLMVFRNEERRNNAAERLLRNTPPVMTQVWLATFAEALAAPLGAIWMRPTDYWEATKGTRFDPTRASDSSIYRRQSEREARVRSVIRRQTLLDGGKAAERKG